MSDNKEVDADNKRESLPETERRDAENSDRRTGSRRKSPRREGDEPEKGSEKTENQTPSGTIGADTQRAINEHQIKLNRYRK